MEIEKFAMQSDKEGRLVQLDCELNDDLLYEGYANELCANMMSWRKAADCGLTDKLNMFFITGTPTLVEVIEEYKDMIFDRVICNHIEIQFDGNARIIHKNDDDRSDIYMTAIITINSEGKLKFVKPENLWVGLDN